MHLSYVFRKPVTNSGIFRFLNSCSKSIGPEPPFFTVQLLAVVVASMLETGTLLSSAISLISKASRLLLLFV